MFEHIYIYYQDDFKTMAQKKASYKYIFFEIDVNITKPLYFNLFVFGPNVRSNFNFLFLSLMPN